jgi:UDP-2-acetamido-3-amino-2,3-dideoxy-glucuronate N-acetyltransferase
VSDNLVYSASDSTLSETATVPSPRQPSEPPVGAHPTAVIEPGAQLAADVSIGAFVRVPAGVRADAGVRIDDQVTFAGADDFADGSTVETPTVLRKGCRIGAGAVLLTGVTIGADAIVQPGSVVTMAVPSHAVVAGNPAKVINYVTTVGPTVTAGTAAHAPAGRASIEDVAGVKLLSLKTVEDMRGRLTVGEVDNQLGATGGLPFAPQRIFYVYDAPSSRLRGEHAHRECAQVLICVRGSLHVLADDGVSRGEAVLDSPGTGLYLPPMVWGVQYRPSEDALLLVLASHAYDPADYLRDYDEYLQVLSGVPR